MPVVIRVIETGFITQVSDSYWETYKTGGHLEFVRNIDDGEPLETAPDAGPTYKELKEILTEADVEFKGNASKAELRNLYEQLEKEGD